MKRTLALALPAVLIFVFACNLPFDGAGTQSDLMLTEVARGLTAAAAGSGTATATATGPAPTSTSTQPAATLTSTSVPCNMASFVADVNFPDNTGVDLNESFTKTWKLKNVGSCTWTSGYQLVFDSGDQMGGPASQQLTNGSVSPGQNLDVSVNLKAPGTAGTYKGNWKLRDPNGLVFALSTGPFWVQIKAAQVAVEIPPPWPIVKSGDSGANVKALQYLLSAHGEALTVDGIFGPVTRTKLEHFQDISGLVADGIAGPNTWPKLILQVQQGANGPAVRAVQTLLNEKFGKSLAVDGAFGPATTTAVKDLQDYYKLAVDGIVGPQTWQMLIGGPP